MRVGDIAMLEVKTVTKFGAFLACGRGKDILVPGNQMRCKMEQGRKYLVRICYDKVSDRNFATMKLDRYIEKEVPPNTYKNGDELEGIVYAKSPMGFKVVLDKKYCGLLYKNEIFQDLNIGDEVTVYVKQVREDGRLDLSLQPQGSEAIGQAAEMILDELKEEGGYLPYSDNSSPAEIKQRFGLSKKVFKKSIGTLYKQRKIRISDKGIKLVPKTKK